MVDRVSVFDYGLTDCIYKSLKKGYISDTSKSLKLLKGIEVDYEIKSGLQFRRWFKNKTKFKLKW